jgi:hypothetical protein
LVENHVAHTQQRQAYDSGFESLTLPLSADAFSCPRKGEPSKRLPEIPREVPKLASTTSTCSNLHQIEQTKMRWKAQGKANTLQVPAHVAMECAASGLRSKHLLRAHRFNFCLNRRVAQYN